MQRSSARRKVGIDLSPVGFRRRAPGTAVHVENQVRALLDLDVDWDWVLVATPSALREAPYFESFHPIVSADRPLTYHACFYLEDFGQRRGAALVWRLPSSFLSSVLRWWRTISMQTLSIQCAIIAV